MVPTSYQTASKHMTATEIIFKPEDYGQKTWIPEGTTEYKHFKLITQENKWIAQTLKDKCVLKDGDLILDVGGREGEVALALQKPIFIHLVDPDPLLQLTFTPGHYWREKIQNVDLSEFSYKLIIFAHVLGYLGAQEVQAKVVQELSRRLVPGGSLALFYNRNTGYMGELLSFSKKNLSHGHYDYFDENTLNEIPSEEFDITHQDVSFQVDYESFEDLSHLCWFLFGAMDQDIEKVAAIFVPKLKTDLSHPGFSVEQRLTLITKK
jgi:hypothetical protein